MVLLNLSTFNSSTIYQNADWVTTLRKPAAIQPGAQIILKQAFLDSQSAGQYQIISIPEDIQITLTFGFAVQYNSVLMSSSVVAAPAQDNQLYIARDPATFLPLLHYKYFVLPASEYGPQDIAVFITREMASFNSVNMADFLTDPSAFLRSTTFTPTLYGPNVTTPDEPIKILNFTTIEMSPLDPAPTFFVVGDTVTLYAYNVTIKKQMDSIDGGQITSIDTQTLPDGNVKLTILTTVFNPTNNRPFQWEQSSQFTNIRLVVTGKNFNMTFYNQSSLTDHFQFKASASGAPSGFLVGSSQIALLFNDENSNRFSITAHNPLYEKNADPSPVISAFTSAGNPLMFSDKFSCTPFYALSPPSFWQSLGFDLSKVLIQETPAHLPIVKLQTGFNISGAFISNDCIVSSTRANYAVPDAAFFYATSLMKNIVADNNYTSAKAGFYLIELSNITTNDYIDDKETRLGIFAIASRNYEGSGYITVYQGSEQTTINQGAGYLLSSIRVRILDPMTKQPIPNSLIGPNNSVCLEILT